MKKLSALLLFTILAFACYAQPADVEVVYSGMVPQIVIWEDVDTDSDGNPLVDGDVIEYEVFYTGTPFDEASAISLGVVQMPEATVDLSTLPRGYYYVGVRSIGTDSGGAVGLSAIAWSNDPVAVDPTQRFAYLVTGAFLPADPTGLRTVQ